MKRFDGRIAVVTGAASGIGAALARALSAEGCVVALADINAAGVAEVAASMPRASAHVVDVGDPEAVHAFAAEVVARHGGAHILVNNAGLTVVGAFEEHSAADFDRVMWVNLGGVVNGCRAFLPHLRRADEAHIVNISSVFGIIAVPGQVAYSTSKFAVRGFSEALAEELAATSIGVTVVHPGGVRTGIIAHSTLAEGAPVDDTLDRLSKFFEKTAVAPEIVAPRIVAAIRANRRRALVTPDAVLLDWMRRLMPVWGNHIAAEFMFRSMGLRRRIGDQPASRPMEER